MNQWSVGSRSAEAASARAPFRARARGPMAPPAPLRRGSHTPTPPHPHTATPPHSHPLRQRSGQAPTPPHSHTATPPHSHTLLRAYTLIEILVVVAVFSILGSILVGLLYGGIRTWRGGESSRQAYEKAGISLEQIREDLSAVYTVEASDTFSPSKPVEVRFVCRYVMDRYLKDGKQVTGYKQELAFIRTIPQRLKNLTATLGGDPGKYPGNLVDDDGDNSARQSDGVDNDGDAWLLRNDGKDNDGDGEIDESDEGEATAADLRGNGLDDDGDGNTDESDEGQLACLDETNEGVDEEFYNLVDDDGDGEIDEDLRPLGDLMQVRYAWRGETLYRGIQAPIHAAREPYDPEFQAATQGRTSEAPFVRWDNEPSRFSILGTPLTPLVTGVLYFGVRFWTPHTTDWSSDLGKENGGPEEVWDSTRGLTLGGRDLQILKGSETGTWTLTPLDERTLDGDLPGSAKRSLEFYYYRPPTMGIPAYNYRAPVLAGGEYDSLFDPSDDVFPRRVQITIVVTNTRGRRRAAFLKGDMSGSSGSVINVDDTSVFRGDSYPYVKVDEEWIRYSHIADERTLVIAPGGRGARGTVPAAHQGGTDVETGTTFVLTLAIPSYREAEE